MLARLFAAPLAISLYAVILIGCDDTSAIADFAGSAAKTAQQGPAIFTDLADTCDARHALDQTVTPAWDKPAASGGGPETCARFRAESVDLGSDSQVLQHYFEAVKDLALFGSAKPAEQKGSEGKASEDNAKSAKEKEDASKQKSGAESDKKDSKKVNTEVKELKATSDLATLIGHLATERYQQSHLVRILKQADPDVAAISQMLEDTVATQYTQELAVEENDTRDLYFRFGKTDAKQNPALMFLLDRAYRDDTEAIAKRRKEADAYAEGLRKLREAHHQLTMDAGSHDLKKLVNEAHDYGGQLETLAADLRALR